MSDTRPTPAPGPENGELAVLVRQSRAPELAAVSEAGGQGALVPVQPPEALVPVRPRHVDDARDRALREEAAAFVRKVREDPGDWKLGDAVFKLGERVMERTRIQVSLYDRKMGDVLREVSEGDSAVGKDILAVKTQLDLVNPVMVQNQEITVTEKVMRFFNKSVTRLPKGDEVIRIIAERRESVRSTIDGIRRHMMAEGDRVARDAAELGVICDHLRELQPELQEEIYRAQLIWQGLTDHLRELAGMPRETVGNLVSDLAMGVVDLQTIDNSNLQTRFGGEMMIRNARLIRRLIQRTDTILTGSVANALAVRVAAAQQMQTLGHLDTIQQSIGQTMVDTSRVVGEAAVEGARMSQRMGVDIAYLQEACDNFEQAADAYAEICRETVKIAGQASNALTVMNERFRARTDAMTAARQEE